MFRNRYVRPVAGLYSNHKCETHYRQCVTIYKNPAAHWLRIDGSHNGRQSVKTILALIGLCVGVNLGNIFTILSRLTELIKQQYRPPPPRQCTHKSPSPKTKVVNTNHRDFGSTCLCTNFGLGGGGRCVSLHGSVASTHPKCCLISSATSN